MPQSRTLRSNCTEAASSRTIPGLLQDLAPVLDVAYQSHGRPSSAAAGVGGRVSQALWVGLSGRDGDVFKRDAQVRVRLDDGFLGGKSG
ncbi:hypothetical protein MCOR25_006983 [Pyricularia grisea]|nr:hypothetical protein MCOR25_006983 [Pyricularia grisea]